MVSHPAPSSGSAGSPPEVMASIDADGPSPRLIIADITVDGSWLSIPTAAAVSVAEWR